ncbi:dihydrolipoamide acetyltransferase [Heterostelium album PN500]|uniref:Acetyltransferase component of pyruvate dehydrogenase complex n=1 Tax=Heterostelium pallidum (strain ATCC 26659 / Pp 5 / PN500) TaxID=670386 RepID=D3BR06_HETP5|nr:dihydrolipoamide acetyltransferase [Heterostelium album PN500]EFA76192.1 dihydrolipoamide acetyltransferase [Heterostelium album PN500]|eukprot:XP_020428325.1 dihydrolipoamide acetyltransferase [Heterostelium album PN500]
MTEWLDEEVVFGNNSVLIDGAWRAVKLRGWLGVNLGGVEYDDLSYTAVSVVVETMLRHSIRLVKKQQTLVNGVRNYTTGVGRTALFAVNNCPTINNNNNASYLNYSLKMVAPQVHSYHVPSSRFYSTQYPPHIKIDMPALSPSMTEGNIVAWNKKVGDQIKVGDIIAQIETDKATMDFECLESGYLAKIIAPEGTKGIPINSLIAIFAKKKEDIEKFKDYSASAAPAAAAAAPAPAAAAAPKEAPKPAAAAPKPAASSKTYPKHIVVGMPALSPSMETGGLAKWNKKVGDQVKVGDIIAQVETDKATMDFECLESGYVAKILVPAGTSGVNIDSPVCILAAKKEDIDKFNDYTVGTSTSAPAESAPAESAAPQQTSTPSSSSSSAPRQQNNEGGRIFSSPAARFVAKEKGVNIADVSGTGPNQRIVKADVLNYQPKAVEEVAPAAAATTTATRPAVATEQVGEYTDIPHSNIRKVTAARLTESKQTIPHYYLTMECRVDKLLKVRTELNGQADGKYKLSVNDFIIKAASAALKDVPTVNSTWMTSAVRRFHNVDINVAVNTDIGLFTPLVRDSDKKGLATIANQVREMADKAKKGKLQPQDFQSGTFTISNLGMFGIKSFSAVINPPQAAILAIGTTESRLVPAEKPKEGELPYETATILSVTLSCDHRVIDGAVGAEWLQRFKDYIENPLKLLL